MDTLDQAIGDLRDAVAHDRGVNLDAPAAAALLGLIGSAARDTATLALILDRIEDDRDAAKADLNRMRAQLVEPPGKTSPALDWRRGRVGMAEDILDRVRVIVANARGEVAVRD